MSFVTKYLIAYVLDLIFGDPQWFPHPVRFIGKLISFLEKYLYKLKSKTFWGGVVAIITITITFLVSYFLASLSEYLEIFFLYTTLAGKCLADEGMRVYKILKMGDLEVAKKQLSYLVSRDTEKMDNKQIIRSILETFSENSVDGIISPMFFAFVGSFFQVKGVSLALPFAMGYKAINTLDSMLGYKNERYINFGTVSAKIDDVANFIPARITGLIFVPLASFLTGFDYKKSFKIFIRDRHNHASPNSAHGESAFAGALGVQFGGKTKYFGVVYDKPTIGDKLKEFELEDILRGRKLLYGTSLVSVVFFSLIKIFLDNIIK